MTEPPHKPYKSRVYRQPKPTPKYRPKTASEEIAEIDRGNPPPPIEPPPPPSLWQKFKTWRLRYVGDDG